MMHFEADNSNDMAMKVYTALSLTGVRENSRNGGVLKFPYPITTTYREPWHRANFTPGRDANPFFHIAESMWMLAGRRDVDFLTYFNSNMAQYSDDGEVFNAAYGYRIRHAFGHDQLKEVAGLLEDSPLTRQAVVQIWDNNDLLSDTVDKACNMMLVFKLHGINLDMIVYNRSNDLVYGGVTGANPVHMSYFQQWVADKIGAQMGQLTFVSADAHVYTDLYPHWARMRWDEEFPIRRAVEYPLGELEEIEELCYIIESKNEILSQFDSLHLQAVVKPIMNCWIARKEGDDNAAYEHLSKCRCPALYKACWDWMERRYEP